MYRVPNRIVLALAAPVLAAVAVSQGQAARDMAQVGSGLEIVVMEVEGCKYCPLFRKDVVPAYSASPRARDVPMRFVDVNAASIDGLKLKSPIIMLPTAIVVRGVREIGRIEGYVAPEDFSRMVAALLDS